MLRLPEELHLLLVLHLLVARKVAHQEAGDGRLEILVLARHVALGDLRERSRADQHVDETDTGQQRDGRADKVQVQHVLELVPLEAGRDDVHRPVVAHFGH